ncbi:hypothetical protein [Pendulispora albinea]|uniref:Glycosyltransferase RgtA/B/C/D-like domain-containing protein n=1 Tax=Pendulispora albinea TaxID=2741071 RepID=A0ABZ2LWA8_9BACT
MGRLSHVIAGAKGAVLAFAILFVTTCVIYARALGGYFIADDLTELDFIRRYEGSWLAFLDPSKMYGDPITHSRYRPLSIYFKWTLNMLFGDHAVAYHVVSAGLHALSAVAVLLLARRLFSDRLTAVLAAVFFTFWRSQSQTVAWITCNFRLCTFALVLWGLVALHELRRGWGIAVCLGSFVLAVGNIELVIAPAVSACFYLHYRFGKSAAPELARRFALATAGLAAITVAFLYASVISNRVFPVAPPASTPDLDRALRFLANLFVPFQCPLGLKLALVALVFLGAFLPPGRVDTKLLLLLTLVSGCALMWAFLRAYALAPRYLYFASVFGSMALAHLVNRIATFLSRWPTNGTRARWVSATVLGGALVGANVHALETVDMVHFEYLGLLGQKLAALRSEVQRRGERARVYIESQYTPYDRHFFAPELEFVDAPEKASHVVDADTAYYQRRLGPDLIDYWFVPWFNP